MEDRKEYMREYWRKNKDRITEQRKQKKHEDPEKYRKQQREYYATHKEQIYQSQRKWNLKNKKRKMELSHESRKRRVERLRAEGVTNAWMVVNYGDIRKYKVVK